MPNLGDSKTWASSLVNSGAVGVIADPTNTQAWAQAIAEVSSMVGGWVGGIGLAVATALEVIPGLISMFDGVPRTQKTFITAQRLMSSSNPFIQLLGQAWQKGASVNIVDSNAPDIAAYYQPMFNYTTQTLHIPFASPLWYELSQVIGEGQLPTKFDQDYTASDLPFPSYVSRQAWNITFPNEPFPEYLHQLYSSSMTQFVNPPPVTPIPSPTPQPGQPPPDQPISQQCCEQIVASLTTIASTINNLPTEQGLANLPQLVTIVQQIATELGVIVGAINGLISAAGQGIGGLGQALETVAQALGTTITNAAGQEVSALNAVSTAIVNALGRIDVDSENSLAGIAHAIMGIDLSKVVDAIKACCATTSAAFEKNPPLWSAISNGGAVDAQVASLADPWPFDQILTLLNSIAKYLGGEAGAVESGLGRLLINVVEPWMKNAFTLLVNDADAFIVEVEATIKKYVPNAVGVFHRIIAAVSTGVESLPKEVLNALLYFIKSKGVVTPETSEEVGFAVLGLGWLIGQALHFLADFGSKLFYPVSSVFSHNAQITVGALGYDEILHQIHRAFFPNAFGKQQTYYYQSQFRPHLPDVNRAVELFARRIIDQRTLDTLLAYNGLNAAYVSPMTTAAYRPLQPRALAAAIGEYQFDRDKLVDVLQFNGLRDQDIETMIEALEQRGLQPLRQAVINEVVQLAGKGLMSDTDVTSALDAQNLSDDAIKLINQRIALLRLHTMATETKAELTLAAKNELITLDQYAQDLAGIGYSDPEIQIARNTVAQFLAAKEERVQARELALEEARVQRLAIRSAQQAFKHGDIEEPVFAAELAAAGLAPDVIAAYSSLAAISTEPSLRLGVRLSARAQKQQSAKLAIKTISEEYKKGLIDEMTIRAGLAANGMSSQDIDATVNYLNALGVKAGSAAAAAAAVSSQNGTSPAPAPGA